VFWQYGDPADPATGCNAIPATTATDAQVYAFLDGTVQLESYGDEQVSYFTPYYYQAATELGAPAAKDAHLLSLLKHRETYNLDTYLPASERPSHLDAQAMVDIQTWVKTEGKGIMFIYGEYDPWSAGAFELGAASGSYAFVAPQDNHGASIGSLGAADQDKALTVLAGWMGAPVQPMAMPRSVVRTPYLQREDAPDQRRTSRPPL
jgi:hypothetical protein